MPFVYTIEMKESKEGTMIKEFERFDNSVLSTVYEGILKLGQDVGHSMSIYYDLDLLNHLLNTDFSTNDECFAYLKNYLDVRNKEFTMVSIKLEKHRFKVTVTPEGITYIISYFKDKPFLRELIDLVKTHQFTFDDIYALFKKHSDSFVCEEVENAEFQYVLYFDDESVDEYKYCFNFDEMGGYYHRLLAYDFDKL